ncbi:MAG: ABC transporter ATP-binding protein/permease [Burkholderiaceae bacterium]|nr:MAG: ABC transporter ATP-binding protein/permease [Burkholderiaceae bacterium]
MRGWRSRAALPAEPAVDERVSDWRTLRRLLPYLWDYRWRMGLALLLVAGAKASNVGVPLLLKALVDRMNVKLGDPAALVVVPVALLLAYGALRLMSSVFTELREWVFSKATQGATRRVSLETFNHLHALSLRFHLERHTGGLTRDIDRGVHGVEALVTYSLYSIFPTLIEVALVMVILGTKLDAGYVWIALAALAGYVLYTVSVTEWRTRFRIEANRAESQAQTRAVDSLLNYETVKYFNNEDFESRRYDESLKTYQRARLKAQTSLSLLNAGQQLIISIGLVAMLWRATVGVAGGQITIGDLVMVNAFMIQLYVPLNFLGVIYRQIKQSLTDLHRMFRLMDRVRDVTDAPGAGELATRGPVDVRFDHVDFGYQPERQILRDLSFTIPAGQTVAVVGPSGAGKSTLARLLYRFYDVTGGAILIAGQDVRRVTQASVHRAIGIVPQDTVLFNDTVAYNIRYGRTTASDAEVEQAARAAHVHDFIAGTPAGYQTLVGERGLKLSGGEKQRVAIARTLLKDPPVLIFDEATSALDSANERAIQAELQHAARGKTTLLIAHRLSTVVNAHQILVMEAGRIVERGTHLELLAARGRYAHMWSLQQERERVTP